MLSLNIFEKNQVTDLNKSNSTIGSPKDELHNESQLKKIKNEIEEQVNKIITGQYDLSQQYEESDEDHRIGRGRGGPGGLPQNQVNPYQTRMESFKARFKMLGYFLFHITGLLIMRRLSYGFSK